MTARTPLECLSTEILFEICGHLASSQEIVALRLTARRFKALEFELLFKTISFDPAKVRSQRLDDLSRDPALSRFVRTFDSEVNLLSMVQRHRPAGTEALPGSCDLAKDAALQA